MEKLEFNAQPKAIYRTRGGLHVLILTATHGVCLEALAGVELDGRGDALRAHGVAADLGRYDLAELLRFGTSAYRRALARVDTIQNR